MKYADNYGCTGAGDDAADGRIYITRAASFFSFNPVPAVRRDESIKYPAGKGGTQHGDKIGSGKDISGVASSSKVHFSRSHLRGEDGQGTGE